MNSLVRTATRAAYRCRLPRQSLSSAAPASRQGSSYESDGKTTVTVLNKETDLGLMVDSYSQVGFRLNNGMVVLGPMAIFPRSILSWSIAGPRDVTVESLELFFRLEPRLDLLVLGLGDSGSRPDPKLIIECKKRGLNIEALATEQACTTFNFLNAEGRCVAAALIPPDNFRINEDDVARTKFNTNRLIDEEYA